MALASRKNRRPKICVCPPVTPVLVLLIINQNETADFITLVFDREVVVTDEALVLALDITVGGLPFNPLSVVWGAGPQVELDGGTVGVVGDTIVVIIPPGFVAIQALDGGLISPGHYQSAVRV